MERVEVTITVMETKKTENMLTMKSIKKYIFALTIALATLGSMGQANAGIPTSDPSLIAGRALDLAGKGARYYQDFQEAADRLQKLKDNYEKNKAILDGMTGEIFSGDFEWNRALDLVIPEDDGELWNMYTQFEEWRNGGNIDLSQSAMEIYNDIATVAGCDDMLYQDNRNECRITSAKKAVDQDVMANAIEGINARMDNIEKLKDGINEQTDSKERDAIIARIGVEQASLQAQTMKLQVYQQMMDKQDVLYEDRRERIESRSFSSQNVISFEPIDFSDHRAPWEN